MCSVETVKVHFTRVLVDSPLKAQTKVNKQVMVQEGFKSHQRIWKELDGLLPMNISLIPTLNLARDAECPLRRMVSLNTLYLLNHVVHTHTHTHTHRWVYAHDMRYGVM